MHVNVRDLIGFQDAITLDDGQKLFDLIHAELMAGKPVELDFSGVEVFASPFFNAAFGQLLRDLEPEDLNRLVRITNLRPVGQETLRLVLQNAKSYYRDPDHRRAVDRALEALAEEA